MSEISLWEPSGLLYSLHLIHVALLPPNGSRKAEDVQRGVRDFWVDLRCVFAVIGLMLSTSGFCLAYPKAAHAIIIQKRRRNLKADCKILSPRRRQFGMRCVHQAQDFMRARFMPILEELPEYCDWQLHVVTIIRPTVDGDPNRNHLNSKDKKYLAAALCRKAQKLGATGGTRWPPLLPVTLYTRSLAGPCDKLPHLRHSEV